jgi:hypothetical protein
MGKLGSALYNRLVIIIPYVWLLLFFLAPFFIVFRISLSSTAIAMPPYEPAFSFADGWADTVAEDRELLLRQLPLPDRRPALFQRLPLERHDRRHLDAADAADRLSRCLRHGAGPAQHPPDAADAGHPALLDELPDPRLRLDRHPQAGRPAEPAAAVSASSTAR